MQTSTTFNYGNPTKLFDTRYFTANVRTCDVSRDGQKFLMIKDAQPADQKSAPAVSIVVVLNWFEELRQRVPAR